MLLRSFISENGWFLQSQYEPNHNEKLFSNHVIINFGIIHNPSKMKGYNYHMSVPDKLQHSSTGGWAYDRVWSIWWIFV